MRAKTIAIVVTFFALFAATIAACEPASDSDEILILEAVGDLYIRGLEVRDFSLIRKVCIPETVLMSAGPDGELRVITLDRWSKRFDPEDPPFKTLEHSIVRVDPEGTAAQVKILFIVDGSRRVTDFLHMLKLDGEWRIVNIIDH